MTELQLGDPVVYQNHIQDMNEIGFVVNSCKTNFKVLWNDEISPRTENYEQLRIATNNEIEVQERILSQ